VVFVSVQVKKHTAEFCFETFRKNRKKNHNYNNIRVSMDIFVKNKTSKRNSGAFIYNNNIIERCQPPHYNKLLTI
jgi:hypothetical protein